MLNATPENAAAHLRNLVDLADGPPKADTEAIARYRRERRKKRILFVATIYRSIPFVNRASKTQAAPNEPKPAT